MYQIKTRFIFLSNGESWYDHKKSIRLGGLDISNWSGDSYILINKSTINFAIPIENGFRLILNSTPFDDGNFIDIDFKSELDELTKFKRWLIA